MSLAAALERAARADPARADAIRPANGDPDRLLVALDREGAARVLEWLLAHEPAAAEELAAAWAEGDAGAAVLAAARETGLPSAGRKLLRRARHRSRSRGHALPQAVAEPRVAKLAPAEEGLAGALVSPVDASGAQLVTLLEANPSGGARIFQIALDPSRGVLDCEAFGSPRGGARRLVRELTGRERFPCVVVPPQAARALVARAAAAQPPDRSPPRAFAEWRSHLCDAPAGAPTPGDLAQAALGPGEGPAALARALELVRQRELGPWISGAGPLARVAERLQEAARGRIIVSGLRKREQLDAVLREAVAEVFGGAEAERTARRFAEAAYWLWKTEREDDARAALAAGAEVREGGPAHSAVLRALLEAALAPLLERLRQEESERESGSLVVKP